MRKQNKNTIGITVAKDVKKLIKEFYDLKYNKTLILEYAASRRDIAKKIEDRTDIIFSHWALLKYSTTSSKLTNNREHWKSELLALIDSVARLKPKPNNNREVVYKLVEAQWFTLYEYNTDIESLCRAIFPKFKEEGIVEKWQDCLPYAKELQKELDKIAKLIAYGDANEISEYIESI